MKESIHPTLPVKRLLILGAAGRDFHDFNMLYRDDPGSQVLAFTAAQIPDIAGRRYPPALAGSRYPDGIPIIEEEQLEAFCQERHIDQVVLAYSDLPHIEVMHLASRALAAGADFIMPSPAQTMLRARVPVIAVSAVRTGCGKSPTTRWLSRRLREREIQVAVIRHPMPYGDLERQAVQRFVSAADLDDAHCTIEEREEYEPHIALGNPVFAGVDYGRILDLAQQEAELILWDGGNNDFPFIRPDLHIVLVDPLRPGDEIAYHPGEAVLRMADLVLVAKVDSANETDVQRVSDNARRINPRATLVLGASPIKLDDPEVVRGRRVVVVEDGPTITHGGMPYGAGYLAAKAAGAQIVDPRANAAPAIARVYARYPHIGPVLPAVGYRPAQLEALRETLNAAAVDLVVTATPCDLAALIPLNKPVIRARYEFAEVGRPGLGELVDRFLARTPLWAGSC